MLDAILRLLIPKHREPTAKDIFKVLKKLQAKGYDKEAPSTGICDHLIGELYQKGLLDDDGVDREIVYIMLAPAFKSWPKFSGDIHYPVPATVETNAHNQYHLTHNLWIGEYGDLRRELLDHLVEFFRKEK